MNKSKVLTYILLCVVSFGLIAQTTRYKGKMVVGNYTRNDVVLELRENGDKADGTIFNTKFAWLMPVTVDADIRGLSRTVSGEKVFISGNNLIPYVKNQPKEKYKVTYFNGVKIKDSFTLTTYFGKKKVTYNGKKIN